MQGTLAVWWNREVVDFVTQEEAEKILAQNPAVRKIKRMGKDGVERDELLVTTPVPQWRTI